MMAFIPIYIMVFQYFIIITEYEGQRFERLIRRMFRVFRKSARRKKQMKSKIEFAMAAEKSGGYDARI